MGGDGHVLEATDENVGTLKGTGEQSVRRSDSTVLAPDEGAHSGTQRAYHGGGCGPHLNQVGHADAVLAVRAVPRLHLRDDVLQSAVGRALHLRRGEHDTAIRAAQGASGLGPSRAVMES